MELRRSSQKGNKHKLIEIFKNSPLYGLEMNIFNKGVHSIIVFNFGSELGEHIDIKINAFVTFAVASNAV